MRSTPPCADNSKPNNCADGSKPETCSDGSTPSGGRPGGRPRPPKCDDGTRPTCSDGSASTCADGSAPVFDDDKSTPPCADNSKPNNCADGGKPETCSDGSTPSGGKFRPGKRPNKPKQNGTESGEDFTPQSRPKKIKKRKSKSKQWSSVVDATSNCDSVPETSWINFTDTNPSQVCETSGEDEIEACICFRFRPGGKTSTKCGSCKTIFLPSSVDGVSLKDIKKSIKPKTDKLLKSESKPEQRPGGSGSSKLSWLQIGPEESCDKFYDTPESSLGKGSPSVICSDGGPSLRDIHCLCVEKNGNVKNVCGTCTKTLKLIK